MLRRSVLLSLCLALIPSIGCPNGSEREKNQENASSASAPVQQIVMDFDQAVVLPTSVLAMRLRGTDRLVADKLVVTLEGALGSGQMFTWSYDLRASAPSAIDLPADGALAPASGVSRFDGDTGDLVARIVVDESLWMSVAPAPTQRFKGTLRVDVIDLLGERVAQGRIDELTLNFLSELKPEVAPLRGGEVYADERVALTGSGFLRPEEGQTLLVIKQGEVTYEDGSASRSIRDQEVALLWDGGRDRARLVIDPMSFGVKVAEFRGEVEFVNRLRTGERVVGNAQREVSFSLQQPFISTLACAGGDPCPGGARGQRIEVRGRGLIAPRAGALMTLRFEGIFKPDDASLQETVLSGDTALERAPDGYIDDQRVEVAVWYEIERVGRRATLSGLGATPGVFDGAITPILSGPDGSQRGLPWRGQFKILPSKQVVYLKYLPRFSSGLEKYGLRNVENEIRDQILAAAALPYRGYNVEFVDEPPQDFLDYATIELSGPDPFGDGTFGYDNSTNDGIVKDTNNLYLADYIGGYNQGSAEEFDNPFGGIYIESFDYFSPTLSAQKHGSAVEDASEEFDRILGPFMPALGGTPVRATELDGERRGAIEEAVRMFGNVIGNTVAHEIGHSMGMTYVEEDDLEPTNLFHNIGDSPGALMDSGNNRSFEERAALSGVAPATFNATNSAYLERILPAPNP